MEILPAIDLKEGCAVRLKKGAMESAIIYSKEPLDVAKKFEDFGAKWLHLVDLDGAFAAKSVNFDVVEKIASKTSLKIELGGGVRDENAIKRSLNAGVERVILGSVALKKPDFVRQMAKIYPIAVGIDAKDGFVAAEGWAEISQIKATELAVKFADCGVKAIIATDISKDGMLGGVNLDFVSEISKSCGLNTIASGGVSSIDDLKAAFDRGIYGIIVGKAYYEGRLDLREAFEKFANLSEV